MPAALQVAGLLLAIIGLVLASTATGTATAATRRGSSLLYGLIAAAGFGGFFVAMDSASQGSMPWALLVARLTAVSVIAATALAFRARPAVKRSDLPVIVLTGLLIVAGDSMYSLATTVGLLSVVSVLSALHTIVTIMLARAYLNDRVERVQRAGIGVTLIGIVGVTAF